MIRRDDRDKFFQDLDRCTPRPNASLLFARKKISTESNVKYVNPTVAMVGGGDISLMILTVHRLYQASRDSTHNVHNLDSMRDLLNSLGSMHETDVKILKDVSLLISRYNAIKKSHVDECVEHVDALELCEPGMISGKFRNALMAGIPTSNKRKSY